MSDLSFPDHTLVIPGPHFHIDLAPLDALHPVHYSRRLLIFRCADNTQRTAQLAALKTGLQAVISRCPILGGIVVPLAPDDVTTTTSDSTGRDWRTFVPDQGIELIVRDLRTTIASFATLEVDRFPGESLPYELLVPVPSDIDNERPFPACKVQFSAIEGGTILTWAMSHSVADGSATNGLLRMLSEETRFAQEGEAGKVRSSAASKADMGLDRSLLRNMTSEIPFNFDDHPSYMRTPTPSTNAPPPPAAPAPHPFAPTTPEKSFLLTIPPKGVARLKADATFPDAPPISTHDALVALIWRTVLLIRSRRQPNSLQTLARTTPTQVFFPSDARRHLNLPDPYVGNAVYQLTASLPLSTLLSPTGLARAATAIRAAITAVTPALVQSYMAELRRGWVEWQFMNGTLDTTGVALGTDWTSGAVFEDDWGEAFGKLVRFRYPGEEGGGGCCVMPRLVDGGAEVVVGCMGEEEGLLRGMEGFGRYLEV